MRKYRLGEEPSEVLHELTPEQRLEMMWPLTLEAWSLTGRSLPTYRRSEAPMHIIRGTAKTG